MNSEHDPYAAGTRRRTARRIATYSVWMTLALSVGCGASGGQTAGAAGAAVSDAAAAPDETSSAACPPPGEVPASACVISGEGARLPQLTVRPEGSGEFVVHVEDVAVRVTPADLPECVPVHVRGRLEFDATGAQVALRPTAATDVEGGMVTLTESTRLSGPVARDGQIAAAVTISDDVTLSPVVVPCAALAIDVPFRFIFNDPSVTPSTPVWVPRASPFVLREQPEGGRVIEVVASAPVLVPFVEQERRGEVLRVEVTWTDGAALRGWVRAADMEQTTAGGYGGDPGGGELHGHGHSGCGGPGRYCGPADIAAGTEVFAEPGMGPWATVVDGRGFDVMLVEGELFAAVREIPGIEEEGASGRIEHAWVPSASVTPTSPVPPAD